MRNIPFSLLISIKFGMYVCELQQGRFSDTALSAMVLTQGDHLGQELTHLIHLRSQTFSLTAPCHTTTFGKAMTAMSHSCHALNIESTYLYFNPFLQRKPARILI